MTRERISFTLDPRDTLLSLQMGFSFVRAALACAVLEGISGLEPSSETTAPSYLKLVTVSNFCPFTFISLWMPLALYVICLVSSVLISILYLVQVLSSIVVLHHSVSRAEFSLTEPIPLQAVYVDHSRNPPLLYCSPRSRTYGH